MADKTNSYSEWESSQFPTRPANSASSSRRSSGNGYFTPIVRNGNGNGNGNGYFNGNGHTNGKVNGNGNGNGNGTHTPTTTPPPLYTARAASTTPRRSQPTKILGAIDENGGMSPDIPIRNPRRKTHSRSPPSYNPRAFLSSLLPTHISAPKNDLDDVTGPRGEKLSDARQNRRSKNRGEMPVALRGKRSLSKRLVCIGLVVVILAAMVAIGLVIGLKRMHRKGNRYESFLMRTFARSTWSTRTCIDSHVAKCEHHLRPRLSEQ